MSDTSAKSRSKKWVPYLIRGIMGIVIAITLVRQFVEPGSKASNFPVYLGVFFLANGLLSFRAARADPMQGKRNVLAALASLIGGLAIIVAFPFSDYRDSLIATDLGRYAFSTVVALIGLLQLQGAVHMTPEPVLKRAHTISGFLEILLAIAVAFEPFGKGGGADNAVALIWTVFISFYMFLVAHRVRNASLASEA